MIKALVKTRFLSLYSSMMRVSQKKAKKSMLLLYGLLMLYALGTVLFMVGMLFNALYDPFFSAGLGWFYFSFAGIMAASLTFIGSIYMTQAQIYDAKDNMLLLSMPIPPGYILASRMLFLYLIDLAFAAMVMLPAAVIYLMNAAPTLIGIVMFIIVTLLLPLLVLAVSCVFGWLIALIGSKLRSKNIVTITISLLFLGAYFYFYSKVNTYLTLLIQNGETIATAIKRSVFPAYHLGNAIYAHDPVSLIIFFLCCAAPFLLVCYVLSLTFLNIVTANRGAVKVKYRRQSIRQGSASGALLKKELRHFLSSPMYILNSSLGVVFTLILPIIYAVKKEAINSMFNIPPELNLSFGVIAILILSAINSFNFVSAPSISLEGQNLWIVLSIPVDSMTVLLSKVRMHMVVCIPATVLSAIALAILMQLNATETALLLFVPISFAMFQAYLGVCVNLLFPKFDWINEITPIKQGLSTLIAMFTGMGVVALPVILYTTLLSGLIDVLLFIFLYAAFIAVITLLLHFYLKNGGSKRFAALAS